MTGCEWVIEAQDCDPAALRQIGLLQTLFTLLVDGMELHPVQAPLWHQFPEPGGVTGLLLLSESHLACHTFPEYSSLCLNVFCCRPRPDFDFAGALKSVLGAGSITVRKLERPYSS